MGIVDVGNDHLFHDPLDQRGFSGPHRANDAYIYIAAGTGGQSCIEIIHSQPPHPAGEDAPAMVLPQGMSGLTRLERKQNGREKQKIQDPVYFPENW
jgi:hypothetical protein